MRVYTRAGVCRICASLSPCALPPPPSPAVNKDELKYLGIKHIMNCASDDVDNMFPEDFTYSRYDTNADNGTRVSCSSIVRSCTPCSALHFCDGAECCRPLLVPRRSALKLASRRCLTLSVLACLLLCCVSSYAIEDTHEGEPSEHFEDSCAVITRIKEERSLIYVHCTEGKTIAPCIVLNYMLQSAKKQNKHLTLLAAYNFLGAKAPGINVPDQFMAQLLEVESDLYDGETSIKIKGGGRSGIGGGHHGSRVGVGRGGRGGRGGKGKRGK